MWRSQLEIDDQRLCLEHVVRRFGRQRKAKTWQQEILPDHKGANGCNNASLSLIWNLFVRLFTITYFLPRVKRHPYRKRRHRKKCGPKICRLLVWQISCKSIRNLTAISPRWGMLSLDVIGKKVLLLLQSTRVGFPCLQHVLWWLWF